MAHQNGHQNRSQHIAALGIKQEIESYSSDELGQFAYGTKTTIVVLYQLIQTVAIAFLAKVILVQLPIAKRISQEF